MGSEWMKEKICRRIKGRLMNESMTTVCRWKEEEYPNTEDVG